MLDMEGELNLSNIKLLSVFVLRYFFQHLGFCYIGDQSHSWLAATQYIAPLMANFDTHGENSTIMYADDGERFVIEWSNLQLREQRSG